jgi:hypothetical protein
MSSSIIKSDNGASSGVTGIVQTAGSDGTLLLQTTTASGVATTALTINNNQIATFANKLTAASMPTGSVLQVVSATYSTQTDSSASAFTATGLTASITPTSTTNKILIFFSLPIRNGSANINVVGTIYKNGSNLFGTYGLGIVKDDSSAIQITFNANYLDSPSTTSSTTYAIYINPNSSTAQWCGGSSTGSITLMEISA